MIKIRLFIYILLVGSGFLFTPLSYAQEGGMFSPYLIGTYDLRDGYTLLHIINPTAKTLEIYVSFFDDNEKFLKCIKQKLSHNDLIEIDVRKLNLPVKFGVVKIVSHLSGKPLPGLVGFQRHYFFKERGVTESNLASVPTKVLEEEYKIIIDGCK